MKAEPLQIFAVLALAIAVLVGGCAPREWRHAQYGTARSSDDLADCARIAHAQALDAQPSMFSRQHPDMSFYEGQVQDSCMRARGYQQVSPG